MPELLKGVPAGIRPMPQLLGLVAISIAQQFVLVFNNTFWYRTWARSAVVLVQPAQSA